MLVSLTAKKSSCDLQACYGSKSEGEQFTAGSDAGLPYNSTLKTSQTISKQHATTINRVYRLPHGSHFFARFRQACRFHVDLVFVGPGTRLQSKTPTSDQKYEILPLLHGPPANFVSTSVTLASMALGKVFNLLEPYSNLEVSRKTC